MQMPFWLKPLAPNWLRPRPSSMMKRKADAQPTQQWTDKQDRNWEESLRLVTGNNDFQVYPDVHKIKYLPLGSMLDGNMSIHVQRFLEGDRYRRTKSDVTPSQPSFLQFPKFSAIGKIVHGSLEWRMEALRRSFIVHGMICHAHRKQYKSIGEAIRAIIGNESDDNVEFCTQVANDANKARNCDMAALFAVGGDLLHLLPSGSVPAPGPAPACDSSTRAETNTVHSPSATSYSSDESHDIPPSSKKAKTDRSTSAPLDLPGSVPASAPTLFVPLQAVPVECPAAASMTLSLT